MRILHVVGMIEDRAAFGGPMSVALGQCRELRRRGHDARIVAGWRGSGPLPTRVEGVPVHLFRLPRRPSRRRARSTPLLRWLRDHAPAFDLAHLHLDRDPLTLGSAAVLRRHGVPYLVQTDGRIGAATTLRARWLDRGATIPVLRGAAGRLVRTPDERDQLLRMSGTAEGSTLLRHGVRAPGSRPRPPQPGPLDVLFLAPLHPEHRVLAFAAAAERLLDEGIEARFCIVGSDQGDLRALQRFRAARPHLRGRLLYQGDLPHRRVVERLHRADLYVRPSISDDPYPLALLEALAGGVPSICTTECPVAGVLGREGAAIIANPTDDALYGAMRRMLLDPVGRSRLSRHAAEAAAALFPIGGVVDVLEERYAACLPEGALLHPRPSLLWVTDQITEEHLAVWDAVHDGADLTVALLDGPAAAGLDPALDGELQRRGYPDLTLRAPGRHRRSLRRAAAPGALHDLIRERPDVLLLDGSAPHTFAVAMRWARNSGVEVISSGPGESPSLALTRAGALAGVRLRVELSPDSPHGVSVRPDPAPARPAVPAARHPLGLDEVSLRALGYEQDSYDTLGLPGLATADSNVIWLDRRRANGADPDRSPTPGGSRPRPA